MSFDNRKHCLCGKTGRFKFDYKTTHGYLCLNHLQIWLSNII